MRVKNKRREQIGCVFSILCKAESAGILGITGLPDQYRRYDETVMEFVVNGSGDIFSLSSAL